MREPPSPAPGGGSESVMEAGEVAGRRREDVLMEARERRLDALTGRHVGIEGSAAIEAEAGVEAEAGIDRYAAVLAQGPAGVARTSAIHCERVEVLQRR